MSEIIIKITENKKPHKVEIYHNGKMINDLCSLIFIADISENLLSLNGIRYKRKDNSFYIDSETKEIALEKVNLLELI